MLRRRLRSFLLVLSAGLVLVSAFFVNQNRRLGNEETALSAQVAKGAKQLQELRTGIDPGKLEREKSQLAKELSELFPLGVEGGEILLQLWHWADQSRVALAAVTQTSPAEVKTAPEGGGEFQALEYRATLVGRMADLNQFLRLALSSAYSPQIQTLSLATAEGGNWTMQLSMVVYSRQGG